MLSTTDPVAPRCATSSSMSRTAEKEGCAVPPLFPDRSCASALTRATSSSTCDRGALPTLKRGGLAEDVSALLTGVHTQCSGCMSHVEHVTTRPDP